MNTLLIVFFALLQVADGVVTYLGLGLFANVDEVNPILGLFAGRLGLAGAITLLKLVGLAFVAFLFFDRHKMKSRWITASLASAVGFYSWVVSNNVLLVAGV
ncbi:MAG: DUF5658 family protein [Candidatus Methylumidiphilus sp.]